MKLKKAGIITKIVIAALIIYAVVMLVQLHTRIDDALAEQNELRDRVTELEVANAEMKYAIEHSTDDDVIADIARDELGLIAPNEKVYYDQEG